MRTVCTSVSVLGVGVNGLPVKSCEKIFTLAQRIRILSNEQPNCRQTFRRCRLQSKYVFVLQANGALPLALAAPHAGHRAVQWQTFAEWIYEIYCSDCGISDLMLQINSIVTFAFAFALWQINCVWMGCGCVVLYRKSVERHSFYAIGHCRTPFDEAFTSIGNEHVFGWPQKKLNSNGRNVHRTVHICDVVKNLTSRCVRATTRKEKQNYDRLHNAEDNALWRSE